MENVVKFISRPELNDPVFIEGLPGVGNVGKIAADYLAEKLNAEKFANIYSRHFPPQVTVDPDCVAHMVCNSLYFAKGIGDEKKDVLFLLGDYQGITPEGQFSLAEEIMTLLNDHKVSKVFTLGGYGTGAMVEQPRVLGAVSSASLKPELEKHGVSFSPGEPGAGIVGASGLLLGLAKISNVDAACLMGETSGFFIDHKSASKIIEVLSSILNVKVDMNELVEKSHQIDEIAAKVKEYEQSQNSKEQLGYIG